MKSCHVVISHWVSWKCCSTWATFTVAEMYLKPLRFRVTRTSSCSKQVAWRDRFIYACWNLHRVLSTNEIWQHGILFETASNLIFDITHCTVSQNWEDSPSKWIGGWHWFQILEHVWLKYMHWNCLDPSYLILHGTYVQRVAADRSVARQAFGLRDVGTLARQDGFQKNKKKQNFLSKVFGRNISMNIFFSFQPTVPREIWWHHHWNSRISGATRLKCASLQVLFWHCLNRFVVTNLTFIHGIKYIKNIIYTSGWRIRMQFQNIFMSSLLCRKPFLFVEAQAQLPTCHLPQWARKNEGKNPNGTVKQQIVPIFGVSPSSGMFQSSDGWTVRLFLIWISMLGLCSIVHGLKVSQTTIALVATQSASNILRILLHRVAAMSKLPTLQLTLLHV